MRKTTQSSLVKREIWGHRAAKCCPFCTIQRGHGCIGCTGGGGGGGGLQNEAGQVIIYLYEKRSVGVEKVSVINLTNLCKRGPSFFKTCIRH